MGSQWLEVAEAQAGVISTAQLIDAGVNRNALRRLIRHGTVRSAYRSVWTVDPAELPTEDDRRLTRLWTALLGSGPRAFAWRRSAAALWALDGCPWPDRPEIAVSVPDHPRRPGAARLRSVGVDDRTVVGGVPATGAARTLADLAVVVDDSVVERALESVLRRGVVSVDDLAGWAVGRRSEGARRLARVLDRRPAGTPPTESDAETRFAIVARSSGLPTPRRQFGVLVGGRRLRVDFAWPEVHLADLRRQNAIVLDGWLVLRFTWWTVVNRPDQVRRDLRSAWAARSALAVGR